MSKKLFLIFYILLAAVLSLPGYTPEDNIEEHFRFGYELYNAGRMDEAEIEFRNLLLIEPELALGYLWLGKILDKKKLHTEAVEVWKKGLEYEPDHKELRKLLGDKIVDGIVNDGQIKDKNGLELIGKKEHEYEIRSGDTLKTIAEKLFQNSAMAAKIAQYNGIETIRDLGVGGILKIPVTEAQMARLTQSEKMEKSYVENQNNGKKIASISSDTPEQVVEEPNIKSIDINEMEPDLNGQPVVDANNSHEEPEAETVQKNEKGVEEYDPAREAEYAKTCREYRKKLDDAALDYSLDHYNEMNTKTFDQNILKKEGYINKIYICPVPDSEYEMDANSVVRCTYHREEGN